MEDNILLSLRRHANVASDDDSFDDDLIDYANAIFFALYQIGVGQKNAPFIMNENSNWSEFITIPEYESVKTYIGIKVRLTFDPPQSSAFLTELKARVDELEWRLQLEGEKKGGSVNV